MLCSSQDLVPRFYEVIAQLHYWWMRRDCFQRFKEGAVLTAQDLKT
jgi:hypothetical protein